MDPRSATFQATDSIGHKGSQARGWPDFGRTAALNVAYYCVSMNSIAPDQRAYEQAGEMPETFYGSEGWGFESLRARHTCTGQGFPCM